MNSGKPVTTDEYIGAFPEAVQRVLKQIRQTIKQAAPDAEEKISYAMPAFALNGKPLVYYAAFKNHIGFYATPTGHEAFAEELSNYQQGKGSVQFPLTAPMPLDLISRIVKFRVKENQEKAAKKKTLRTCKNGHKYYKTSDCPTCPTCENERKPQHSFFTSLAAPARRALENNSITSPEKLAAYSEKEILNLHGMGKNSIPKLKEILAGKGLTFKP